MIFGGNTKKESLEKKSSIINSQLNFFCRDIFLDLLFIWMTTLVADKSLPFMFDSEPGLTHNQLVAKKQFIDLDRNRNGVGDFIRYEI